MFSPTKHARRHLEVLRVPSSILFAIAFVYLLWSNMAEKKEGEVPVRASLKNWLLAYYSVAGLIFSFCYIYENLRGYFIHTPRHLSLTNDYLHYEPQKAHKLEAFEYDTPLTWYEKAKMIFFIGTGIALIRFVFFVVFISIAMMLFSFAGNRRESPKRFLVFSQLCVFFGNIALAAVGIYKVQLYGEKVAPRSKCKLIISNHNCAIEVILIWVLSHFPSFVSRRENCKFPFFSGIIKACDGVLVDRSSASSRQRTLEAIIEHAEDPSSSQLIIFPEGTTGNQRTLFLFRKGAFEAGVPVQMICVYFPYKHFNPAWTGRETGGNNLKDIALRLCSQFVTHAEVRVLPVYYPTEEEKANAIVYANHCQKMMACVLKEKVSDATTKYAKEAAAAYEQKKKMSNQQQ